MITIAVTGGIGAGKSTVTDHLIELGYTVIDADKMSRDMTAAGGKAMRARSGRHPFYYMS